MHSLEVFNEHIKKLDRSQSLFTTSPWMTVFGVNFELAHFCMHSLEGFYEHITKLNRPRSLFKSDLFWRFWVPCSTFSQGSFGDDIFYTHFIGGCKGKRMHLNLLVKVILILFFKGSLIDR